MARSVPFPESNLRLVAPGCNDLLAHRTAEGQIISCWKLSADELAEVRATGQIWLYVWGGQTQPPVAVTGAHPFREVAFG